MGQCETSNANESPFHSLIVFSRSVHLETNNPQQEWQHLSHDIQHTRYHVVANLNVNSMQTASTINAIAVKHFAVKTKSECRCSGLNINANHATRSMVQNNEVRLQRRAFLTMRSINRSWRSFRWSSEFTLRSRRFTWSLSVIVALGMPIDWEYEASWCSIRWYSMSDGLSLRW